MHSGPTWYCNKLSLIWFKVDWPIVCEPSEADTGRLLVLEEGLAEDRPPPPKSWNDMMMIWSMWCGSGLFSVCVCSEFLPDLVVTLAGQPDEKEMELSHEEPKSWHNSGNLLSCRQYHKESKHRGLFGPMEEATARQWDREVVNEEEHQPVLRDKQRERERAERSAILAI